MENVVDIGEVGGEDGGKGEYVRCLLGGSWDMDGSVGEKGDTGGSELEDVAEEGLHCECTWEFVIPVIFRGARPVVASSINRDMDSGVEANGREYVLIGIGLLFQRPRSEDVAKHVCRWNSPNASYSSSSSLSSSDIC
jgi:hypothetical protein